MRLFRAAWLPIVGAGLFCIALKTSAQTLPTPSIYAIVNARIEVGDGRVIPRGNVILRDGMIVAVGPDAKIPADAEVVKGDGLTVYPGFIDSHASAGLKLPDAQPDQDTPPEIGSVVLTAMREADRKAVRADIKVVNYLALTDASLTPIRRAGFTTEMLCPTGGLINGLGGLVNLSSLPKRECVVKPVVGMGFGFSTGERGGGYPGSLLGGVAQMRQTLLDAQRFQLQKAAFTAGSGSRPPADDVLENLQPVLDGSLQIIFSANTENEIVRALRIVNEFHLHPIISGGLYAFKQADVLAKRQIPVLVSLNFGAEPGAPRRPDAGARTPGGPGSPRGGRGGRPGSATFPPLPQDDPGAMPTSIEPKPATSPEPDDTPKAETAERKRLWNEKVANVAKLNQAGILFAFTTKDNRNLTDFWDNMRLAIKAGLPKDMALRGLTLNAAKIFGVDKQLGTVETGKVAALTVTSGDIFDAKSRVKYLFIDTTKFDTEKDKPAAMPPQRPLFFPGDDELPE